MKSVEKFMRQYFLVAKNVGDLTAIFCASLEEQQKKPRAHAPAGAVSTPEAGAWFQIRPWSPDHGAGRLFSQ